MLADGASWCSLIGFLRPDAPSRDLRGLLACPTMADVEPVAAEASAAQEPTTVSKPEEHSLIVDELAERFDQFRVLRKADPEATDRLLDEIGAHEQVDRDIVLELSATRALGRPERFRSAHELAMRSLEVLDRNGARGAKLDYVGPAEPFAQFAVQFFTRLIVRNYESDVIDAIRNLYTRRLAWCAPDDPHRHVLAQARLDAVGPRPPTSATPSASPRSCSAAPSSPPASACSGRSSTGLSDAARRHRHLADPRRHHPVRGLVDPEGRGGGPPPHPPHDRAAAGGAVADHRPVREATRGPGSPVRRHRLGGDAGRRAVIPGAIVLVVAAILIGSPIGPDAHCRSPMPILLAARRPVEPAAGSEVLAKHSHRRQPRCRPHPDRVARDDLFHAYAVRSHDTKVPWRPYSRWRSRCRRCSSS